MGIYIKNMEMPKNCYECRFCVDGWCYVIPPETRAEKERITTNYCPLIAVPDHGRLIDADALMKILSKVVDVNASIEQRNEAVDQEMRCLWWFEQQIEIAPTIIESEE